MNVVIHCPDCGAITRVERDDEDTLLICTNDECYRVVVAVLSTLRRTADDDRSGGRNTLTRFHDPDFAS